MTAEGEPGIKSAGEKSATVCKLAHELKIVIYHISLLGIKASLIVNPSTPRHECRGLFGVNPEPRFSSPP
jgi:hypothetical protein